MGSSKDFYSPKRNRKRPKQGQIDFQSTLEIVNTDTSDGNDIARKTYNNEQEEQKPSANFLLKIISRDLKLVFMPTYPVEILSLLIVFAFIYFIVRTSLKVYVFNEDA